MKKVTVTLEDLFNLPGAEIFNPDDYKASSHVTIDSRILKSNSIFLAIKGEKFDGHDFVTDVIKKGTNAVIINKSELKRFARANKTIVTVDDTTRTLGDLASVWRKKLIAKVIGVTGSNGKTTVKEMLTTLLSERFNVKSTKGNNNNHIGVPLTIFSCNEKTEVLVAEVGTNHFGEISYSSKILQPDVALITNIGASHLEYLKNHSGVLKEKIALFDSVSSNGLVFVNADDPRLCSLAEKYKSLTYGFSVQAQCRAVEKGITSDGKAKIDIQLGRTKLSFSSPLLGTHNAKNIVAAVVVASKMGLTKSELLTGIKKIVPVKQRLNPKVINQTLLIDDTYNANPQSMKSAIETLSGVPGYGKKIAVLGDMFELGEHAKKEHVRLSSLLKKNKIDEVYLIGKQMKSCAVKLKERKVVSKYFAKREQLDLFLSKGEFSNAAVLVKGSRGMKMEEFVTIIERKIRS